MDTKVQWSRVQRSGYTVLRYRCAKRAHIQCTHLQHEQHVRYTSLKVTSTFGIFLTCLQCGFTTNQKASSEGFFRRLLLRIGKFLLENGGAPLMDVQELSLGLLELCLQCKCSAVTEMLLPRAVIFKNVY